MTDTPEAKTCNQCHVERPTADFARDPNGNGYHRTSASQPHLTCKRCRTRRSAVERERRRAKADRELLVEARLTRDNEAWIAEGWAALAASREEATG